MMPHRAEERNPPIVTQVIQETRIDGNVIMRIQLREPTPPQPGTIIEFTDYDATDARFNKQLVGGGRPRIITFSPPDPASLPNLASVMMSVHSLIRLNFYSEPRVGGVSLDKSVTVVSVTRNSPVEIVLLVGVVGTLAAGFAQTIATRVRNIVVRYNEARRDTARTSAEVAGYEAVQALFEKNRAALEVGDAAAPIGDFDPAAILVSLRAIEKVTIEAPETPPAVTTGAPPNP